MMKKLTRIEKIIIKRYIILFYVINITIHYFFLLGYFIGSMYLH